MFRACVSHCVGVRTLHVTTAEQVMYRETLASNGWYVYRQRLLLLPVGKSARWRPCLSMGGIVESRGDKKSKHTYARQRCPPRALPSFRAGVLSTALPAWPPLASDTNSLAASLFLFLPILGRIDGTGAGKQRSYLKAELCNHRDTQMIIR